MNKYEEAKKIYFMNWASTDFMSRNGELKTYLMAKVPTEIENSWKNEIKQKMVSSIKSGENLSLIWHISNMDISFEEMMEIYEDLSKGPNRKAILEALYKHKPLFDIDKHGGLWRQIVALFES